jgi:hypothetical protein
MVRLYVELPLWLIVLIICLVVFPFGAIVAAAGLVFTGVRILIWYGGRQKRKREEAIRRALDALPKAERLDYANRAGRYSPSGAVPRTLDPAFMTLAEKGRWREREGEFSEG